MASRVKCLTSPSSLWSCPILSLLLLFSFAYLSVSLSQFVIPSSQVAIDQHALISFKSLLSDPSEALASWGNTSIHFCHWRGVTCNNLGGEPRVTALELENLILAGPISASLANLTFLEKLNLGENQLKGPIPQELGLLSHLRSLDLSVNSLEDVIPLSLFQNCSNLQNFNLSVNRLHGTIPGNLSNCLDLQFIRLERNMLEGEIPSDIYSLPKLQELNVWNNSLIGRIPPEIGNLSTLTILSLSGNKFRGPIPPEIEYGMATKVSTKGDVYSFGILLLEMFTGKGPTSDTFKEGMNLHKFVEMALPTRIAEILDPYLLMEIEEADGTDASTNESKMKMLECSTSVLRVGILCSKESPKDRLHMEDAMKELINIMDAFPRLAV